MRNQRCDRILSKNDGRSTLKIIKFVVAHWKKFRIDQKRDNPFNILSTRLLSCLCLPNMVNIAQCLVNTLKKLKTSKFNANQLLILRHTEFSSLKNQTEWK